ncbi:MAG: Antitoxin HicB [Candidatus Celerinatantimonas neptuna]|nr:MAG: Antitoxin HicB [Candidatus Celerinatantimonas neptuna]
MYYPVNISRDGNGFLVQFPDIPEAISYDISYKGALENARGALVDALSLYFEYKRRVPMPSDPKDGPVIAVPASIWSKTLVLNAMIDDGITASELARRMNTSPQSINRIVNLKHTSKIDTLNQALRAMGRKMTIDVERITLI